MILVIRAAIIALSLALCTDCATARPKLATGTITVAPPAPDLSGVLSIMGATGMAQACPIAADKALTAGHVAKEIQLVGTPTPIPYIWESSGHLGLLGDRQTTVWDRFRDLAYVTPYQSTFPRWYTIAHDAPKPGDKVRFRGFDFRRKRDAFAPRDFQAIVLRVVNGHVIFSPPGVHGTSGSCVLNEAGEVVAINSFGADMEDRNTVGGAVGVWGDLLELGTS